MRNSCIEHYDGLRYIYLNNCLSLTNNCLQFILKLRSLASMKITNTAMDMAQLGRMVAHSSLKTFDGSELEKADVLCREISFAKNLDNLSLDNNPDLSDDGLVEIRKIPNLRVLSLANDPKVKNDGVAQLSNLKHLTAVNFQQTNLTADIMPALKRFPHGCHLVVDTEKWTKADQMLFKKEFPNLLVP